MENRGGLFSCRICLPLLPSHVCSQGLLHSMIVRKSSLKVLLSWRFFPNSIKICIMADLSRSTHIYIWTIYFLSAHGSGMLPCGKRNVARDTSAIPSSDTDTILVAPE